MEGSSGGELSHPIQKPNTGFFDEEYVSGLRTYPARDRANTTLNPSQRASPTYQDVLTAQLTTLSDVYRHEERIYQPGYTPTAIKANITSMLRHSNPDQHMVDFQERDIPPPDRDAVTHRLLTHLMQKRNEIDQDFSLPPDLVGVDGQPISNARTYETEYLKRDKEYNRLNRSMYHVYAASSHVIHDRNFLSYCRPSLRNLPVATAFKIATLKESLKPTTTEDLPPYQLIEKPATTQTQPTFSAPQPSFADVVRPPLKQRAEWMKQTPPFMTESDADSIWHKSNNTLFGLRSPTKLELQQQIDHLQQMLRERTQQALPLPPKETLMHHERTQQALPLPPKKL
jgi:hypothetical protein